MEVCCQTKCDGKAEVVDAGADIVFAQMRAAQQWELLSRELPKVSPSQKQGNAGTRPEYNFEQSYGPWSQCSILRWQICYRPTQEGTQTKKSEFKLLAEVGSSLDCTIPVFYTCITWNISSQQTKVILHTSSTFKALRIQGSPFGSHQGQPSLPSFRAWWLAAISCRKDITVTCPSAGFRKSLWTRNTHPKRPTDSRRSGKQGSFQTAIE